MTLPRKGFLKALAGGSAGLLAGSARLRAGVVNSPTAGSLPECGGPGDEAYWTRVREAYLLEPGFRYFNTGGLGPAPSQVLLACENTARQLQRRSETGYSHFASARAIAARFFGASNEEIAFTRNATEGNSIISGGLRLSAGDEVILDSHAHPGGSFPWLAQERIRGIRVRFFEPDVLSAGGNLERISSLITARTRVVQVSHVTAPTGIVLPVRAIAGLCRSRGIWFHVDGAQSAGMFPVDLREMGCDSYAASGHKWLGGPHETGFLFVSRSRQEQVDPVELGGHGAELETLPGKMRLPSSALRFESGTRNAASIAGLAAALEWQEAIGPARIAARGGLLMDRVASALSGMPDVELLTPATSGMRASIVAFRTPRLDYRKLCDGLLAGHRCRCRVVSEQGLNAVRVSTHLCNLPADCDALVEGIAAQLRKT